MREERGANHHLKIFFLALSVLIICFGKPATAEEISLANSPDTLLDFQVYEAQADLPTESTRSLQMSTDLMASCPIKPTIGVAVHKISRPGGKCRIDYRCTLASGIGSCVRIKGVTGHYSVDDLSTAAASFQSFKQDQIVPGTGFTAYIEGVKTDFNYYHSFDVSWYVEAILYNYSGGNAFYKGTKTLWSS